MTPDDFVPVIEDDEVMHDLAGMVVQALEGLSMDLTPDEIQEAVHDKVLETMGEIYLNEDDLSVQDNFSLITEDSDWTRKVAWHGLLQAAGYTQHVALVNAMVATLRQDEAWSDLADLAAAYRQPASIAWLQEAAGHLGEAFSSAHQDLLRALSRQEVLQATPAISSTARSPMRRRS